MKFTLFICGTIDKDSLLETPILDNNARNLAGYNYIISEPRLQRPRNVY